MKNIGLMQNTIQEYEWGSRTAIATLLGKTVPTPKPQAELWMGTHPKAPSMVHRDGEITSLARLIEEAPNEILGNQVTARFGRQLPYLFKVLAAAKPLSIQAHPNLLQAQNGFKRENEQKIPLAALHRNYKDPNHKPECICALTPFWALVGFRRISEILGLMGRCCARTMAGELANLAQNPDQAGLKQFFQNMMLISAQHRKEVIREATQNALKHMHATDAFQWIIRLYGDYPDDLGVLAPLFLNLICLQPGQAMFLQAGALHAYLEGVGLELMANSDNVLRGGLTPKHIDLSELMKVINFNEEAIQVFNPEPVGRCESIYRCPVEEFVLTLIWVKEGSLYESLTHRSVEILLCIEGTASVLDLENEKEVLMQKGTSLIVPAALRCYRIEGEAKIYKAAVPL